ncbi:hypothetical protein [Clostridium haemolyticum]|nr:hypothetical protein [Clostridium haemolyticum]
MLSNRINITDTWGESSQGQYIDYIVETHIEANGIDITNRIIEYKNFEEYISRIENKESFVISCLRYKSNKHLGWSLPNSETNLTIESISKDIENGRAIFRIIYKNKEKIVCYQKICDSKLVIHNIK